MADDSAPRSGFQSSLTVTFVGTATALLEVAGATFLTDPYFSPAGTQWDLGFLQLTSAYEPALGLADLPPVDAVLLSHEDHPDNLDARSRPLLDGRRVLTTADGAARLAPRPGVRGLRPWEKASLAAAGVVFDVLATPCLHVPGGECVGFVLSAPARFGSTGGKPNAVYFSGDTVYLPELARLRDDYHISAALLNLGAATVQLPGAAEPLLVTMDGAQAARLIRDIDPDVVVPMHFEAWNHFRQGREPLAAAFEAAGVADRVRWLEPGKPTRIL
ncbi:Metallo-hydrolase/oxidoreductase [Durotheca rogersii]|uniref:Metallo-hydrolase/oxidoreductase n=1 Tax=Durotheca rogersii TaxID=419775 RepID=UPI00221EC4C9|nr:Metallo-hydrolase/oxidoreductase [Durotheca rogersii]KAI5856141.1 Metallo-hydrolase/oxidoreductase [Durotheca rogersii]